MKILIATVLFFHAVYVHAQTVINGTVTDRDNIPITGANVFLKGTYDGASTNDEGKYSFTTEMQGEQSLVVTFIGYRKFEKVILLAEEVCSIDIILEEDISKIDEVVITAGAFEAGDKKKSVVLNSYDIVTTAGATADITGVMNNLPGTQTVGEDGKLYVRGGSSREVKTFIDGMLVPKPFGITPSNVPSRFRFSPFLFKGTFFSTGGYSAEYGDALSSVLVLETSDLPERSQTDLSLMSVGADVNQTIKWGSSSLYAQMQYTNLDLYYNLVPQEYRWKKAPQGVGGIVHYKRQFKNNGSIKIYSDYQSSSLNVVQPYFMDVTQTENVIMEDRYFYNNFSFNSNPDRKISFSGGVSATYFKNRSEVADLGNEENAFLIHSKLISEYTMSDNVFIKGGGELKWERPEHIYINQNGEDKYIDPSVNPAAFLEGDIFLNDHFIIRPGIRVEYSTVVDEYNIAPRFSMAYKPAKYQQYSFATGRFFQVPSNEYWFSGSDVNYEIADHYILNYQYSRSGKIFRSEVYYKKYHDLISFDSFDGIQYEGVNNSGKGYARGFELFWRDRSGLKYGDYWLSYSFLDTKRQYKDYPGKYTPPYASAHNFSVVYKYFVQSIRSQVGVTYHFASSRPFDDPNTESFMDRNTRSYHDLSLNYSFLFKPNIIIHASVSNVLGFDHDFGRQYSLAPNDRGLYESVSVGPAAKRFIFLGCFITLSKDPDANQLNNL